MRFKRRRYIVDTRFQAKFIVPFIVIVIIGSVTTTLLFNYAAVKRLEPLIWSAHINLKTTDEIIGSLFVYVNIANFFFVSFVLTLAGVRMMKMLSGTLYRMVKDIRRVTEGDLSTSITLRRKDVFQDVAEVLNNIIKNLRERFHTIKQNYAKISNGIHLIESALRDGKPIDENMKDVFKRLDTIKERIRQK